MKTTSKYDHLSAEECFNLMVQNIKDCEAIVEDLRKQSPSYLMDVIANQSKEIHELETANRRLKGICTFFAFAALYLD